MPPRATIRILIADDHAPFTEAVQAILREDERLEVVGTARDGAEAVELARALQPDIVLMDISMPVLDGIAATREIAEAAPDAQVLVLSGSSRSEDFDRARRAGARAYATKDQLGAGPRRSDRDRRTRLAGRAPFATLLGRCSRFSPSST